MAWHHLRNLEVCVAILLLGLAKELTRHLFFYWYSCYHGICGVYDPSHKVAFITGPATKSSLALGSTSKLATFL